MAIQRTLKTLQCNKIKIKYNNTKFKLKTNQTLTREIIYIYIYEVGSSYTWCNLKRVTPFYSL